MNNKPKSLAERINFGGKNKPSSGTKRSYGSMRNANLDKAKKLYQKRKMRG